MGQRFSVLELQDRNILWLKMDHSADGLERFSNLPKKESNFCKFLIGFFFFEEYFVIEEYFFSE